MPSISQAKVDILKRQATRLQRSQNLTRSQALDHIALEYGYPNWSQLAKSVNVIVTKPHEIDISCFIRSRDVDATGDRKFWFEYIPSLRPPKFYDKFKWMSYRKQIVGSESSINERLATVRRGVEFMDSTGLRPSLAWSSIFRGLDFKGLDHTAVWRDSRNRVIVTSEPYLGVSEKVEAVIRSCEDYNWSIVRTPKHVGIWNPCVKDCSPNCMRHTTMFVMAPKKNGGDPTSVLQALKLRA